MSVQLKEKYDLYINGQWVPASDGKTFVTTNPATGEKLAECAQATKDDVDAAVKAAWAAFPAWRDWTANDRAALLNKIADIIEENAEELATIVDTIEEEGVFNEREKELIKSALELPDTTAREIMTPRVDVVAFDINEDLHELLTDEAILKYSRIPVYDERLDNIIGILSIKKLMRQVVSGEPIDVRSLLSEPLYVHMTRTVSSILREFRRSHTHVAVVIDEFGGMMGLLTLEDIMEEIVGEIYDERDEAEEPEAVEDEKTGVFTVDGSMNIYDLFTEMEYTPHDFDSEECKWTAQSTLDTLRAQHFKVLSLDCQTFGALFPDASREAAYSQAVRWIAETTLGYLKLFSLQENSRSGAGKGPTDKQRTRLGTDSLPRGIFTGVPATFYNGENLDLPTYWRIQTQPK